MKNEEQFLLNYMYQKGYTDEDMHDQKKLKTVRYSVGFCIHRFNLGFARIAGAFKIFGDRVVEIWTNVKEEIQEM